ncbi:MAG: type II toxin-antitoxin system HicA family toxin [Steroidobacteraceae bacterium]
MTVGSPGSSMQTVVHREVLLARVTDYGSEGSVWFDDLRRALRLAGFCERARGSHFVYSRRGDGHVVTLQARDGRARPYQVRQVRRLIR